jgi:hypothetical protein
MRWVFRAIALLIIPVGIASFYNVYSDEPELEVAAHKTACGERGARCGARMAKQARSPFKRAYVFDGAGGRVQVDCRRAFVFVGDWSCARAPRVEL